MRAALAVSFVVLASSSAALGSEAKVVKHVTVYQEDGRFAGWPANHGAWSWGNEIVVGFETGYFEKRDGRGHAIDYSRPAEHVLARSLDGGETWTIEKPTGLRPPAGEKIAGVPTGDEGRPLTDCPGGIDFTAPGFALSARMTSVNDGQSRFYTTLDKGKTWSGPYRLQNFDQPGTAARTDYLVNGTHDLTMFLTVAKQNGKEGRVIAVRTRDGAKTWSLEGFVGPEPEGRDYSIMPSSLRLSGDRILTMVRHRKFIDAYVSKDEGKSWTHLNRPVDKLGGNPPSLARLKDGRIALTYGYRLEPYGIRARLSSDEGKTWGEEIVLRDDGGNWDLGYTRTMQRPDGKMVTVYYYNLDKDTERFIGGTIWDPGSPKK